MHGSDAPAAPLSPLTRAVELASVGLALIILPAVVAALVLRRLEPVAACGLFGIVGVALYLVRFERPRSWLPTSVTALRLLLTLGLALVGLTQTALTVVALVLIVFTLDWVDGQLARRLNAQSTLGGHLDCETDALLTMIICLLLYLRGPHGPWVLTAGFLRYVYVLAVQVVPSRGLVPRSILAARAFGFALVGLLLGFLEVPVLSWLGPAVATALLCFSFGHSFYWSFRNDPRNARRAS